VIEIRDIDPPSAGPGDVVVRIGAALTCGTDLKAYRRGHPLMPMPTVFGHEFAGTIAAAGRDVTAFSVGDAVMSVHTAPCGACFYCRRGLENLCPHTMDTKVLGAYAEYIRIPEAVVKRNMYPKPPGLSYREAAMLEPLACVVYGIEQAGVRPGDTAVVVGAGAIGLLHVMALKAMGVERVVVSGHRPYRLHLARQVGADVAIDSQQEPPVERVLEATGGYGAGVVFECTGQPAVWEEAAAMACRGGTVVLFGGCPRGTTVTYDTARLHYDQLTLKGVFHFTPEAVHRAYTLLAEGRLDVSPLITGDRPLDDLPAVFRDLATGDCIKYAIIP
jgi:L-iditol 2-dehydrogenase